MSNLTEEQKSQNVAALRAAYAGKPWQYRYGGEYWHTSSPDTLPIEKLFVLGYTCRPAPEPEPPRPWDMKTCPSLPFEVVTKRGDVRTTVCSATNIAAYTHFHGSIYWENLLRDFTLRDGSPCGVQP